MHFFVSSFSLLQKLYVLHKIIDPKNNSEYFIFELFGEKLMILISDSENNMITTEIQVSVKKNSKEKIAIPTKLIIDLLKTFPKEDIILKKEKKILYIYSEQGYYPIPTIYEDQLSNNNELIKFTNNFLIVNTQKITLSSKILLKILNKTLFAIGNEYFNPIMNGVYFNFSPYGATFVATDTYKLVKYTINNIKLNHSIEFTIPKKSLKILQNILKEEKETSSVTIEYNKIDIIKFYFENKTFLCRLINERYPDYNSVIPKNKDMLLIINRLSFLNSVKRVSIFSKEKISFIRFCLDDEKLKIYEENPFNYSKIKCKYIIANNFQYRSIKLGFNSKFLIETLSSFNDDFVSFELYDKVGIFRPYSNTKKEESFLILIMSVIV
ncbi:MAG: DNA polymerase III subunit beta [Flavobacteriales bacterium]|jgi:DNA polymerase-3 subunit beta|uniref:DNA polymerase III subunit beta n=1 Tax=Blattabacterium sp. (Mastotermes darwiniensis) TaxID=39768 RepID=UPI000231DF14|nr:DNA polymerase III subunit beta [Blattabacterium sp. (Mastotermes darwiniensis)]AER40840.1 DNA polymerase III, beta subunit [Blattabacterium sp. (Mastotermes darwiniensis) str. MADAR]MDR1804687.1 DNA polymerase III subunit beta [Flavobacteriales bacterium]